MSEHEAPEVTASESAGDKGTNAEHVETQASAAQEPSVSELMQEIADLKEQMAAALQARQSAEVVAQPPTASQPSYDDQLRSEMQSIAEQNEALEAEIRVLAERGNDPVAKALIQQRRILQTSLKATAWSIQQTKEQMFYMGLPESERTEAKQFVDANRHRFADLDAAYDAYLGQRFKEERASLTREKNKAASVVESVKRGVVGTGVREVPAAEMRERVGATTMTEDAFDTKLDALRASGKFAEARDMERQLAAGRIVLK